MYGIYLFNLARINNCQLNLKLLFPITQQRQLKNSHNLNSLSLLTIYSRPDAMLINILVYISLHEKKHTTAVGAGNVICNRTQSYVLLYPLLPITLNLTYIIKNFEI